MPRGDINSKTRPRCHACGKLIAVPPGWSIGPAVRRHYWAKHPDVMQPTRRARRSAR